MTNKDKVLPGWTLIIDEFSPGICMVTLTDRSGRKAEIIDNHSDETISKAIEYAFDIEKRISNNWTKFLFDLSTLNIGDIPLESQEYLDYAFGSWTMQKGGKRILYDGKENWLVLQVQKGNDWEDKLLHAKSKLTYKDLMQTVCELKEEEHYLQ